MTLRITPAEIVERAERSGTAGLLGIDPSWSRIRLGDVARVINGAPFKSEFFNAVGRGLPLIRIRDIGAWTIQTWYDGPWDEQQLVRHGDLLVGMDGDFRAARWEGPEALLNQRVCRIAVTSAEYDHRFLALVLQGYLDAIWSATSSVTVKHLSSRSIADIPLPNPPFEVQRRIVEILDDHLSRLDAAATSIGTAKRRLETLAASRFRQLLPVNSPIEYLGNLAVRSGYGTSTKCVPGGPGMAVTRIPNLVDGRIDLSDEKRAQDPRVSLESLMLQAGDLLVIRTNGSRDLIGRTAVVQDGIVASFASYLIRFQFDRFRVDPLWIDLVMNQPSVRRAIESLAASSAGQYNLSLAKLNALAVPVPAPADQTGILRQMRELGSARVRLASSLADARHRGERLRRALLAAAFSGRLTGAASDSDRIEPLADAM